VLKQIYVNIIPNRNGQLLREALQERLDGTGDGGEKHYELSVKLSYAGENVGIQPDTSSSRTRFVSTANWSLHKPGLIDPLTARM